MGTIQVGVTAARLEQSDAEARPYIARQARTYFDWARRLIAPGKPVLVAVGGDGATLTARTGPATLEPGVCCPCTKQSNTVPPAAPRNTFSRAAA